MQVHELTGIGKNPFPLKHIDNEPPTPEPIEGCMRIAFGEPVDDPVNKAVIKRAALLVFQAETNKDTWTITHKEVNFTKRNLEEFGKEVVRTWQQAYKTKKDEIKRNKKIGHADRNCHIQRQQANADAVIAMYHKKHPGTNVTPLLRTPFMTEENSEYSNNNHRQDTYKKAGLTDQDIANGVKVLEQISLSWRFKKNNPGIPVQVKWGGPSGFSDDKYLTDEYFQSSSSKSDGQNALNLKKATIEEQEDQ
ncbi:hypothetical protein PHLCEN_2v7166 [Hermanssonia centrifuga]|uniref:Uncharacterized protein n=1 Tax=Hermanssonia centrifuga TaxID=98765 RepID=A0A2R6NXB6_9APHY|nr:hypothetical protein PHLCEN_2v7166 [Hermanssonia centrifuga]